MEKENNLEHLRHTLAHLLAQAVLELYPDAKPTIGPPIENGFYYDFEFPKPLKEEGLGAIEEKMRELLPAWTTFHKEEKMVDEAKKYFQNNLYKQELIDEIHAEGQVITFYTAGGFTDLCRGGHLEQPADSIDPDAFKLDRVAGAYWRGSEENPMLTRIYGLAFETKEDLEAYEQQRAAARERDHRKIGAEQQLFYIDEMVGKGLVMWLPNGTILKQEIEKLAIAWEDAAGYRRVSTPHIAKEELYLTSGHLPYYEESMYPKMEMDDGTYYLRAMNCPHHHRIYLHTPKSYRDLPLRLAEYGTVYRNELSGTLAGLLRVRGLEMNDAHIYCSKDQIKDEFKNVMELTQRYFSLFGLQDYWFRLSKWDSKKTEKYIDEPENWEFCEATLRSVLDEMDVAYTEVEDEAAFYGPKVDVQFTSVIGREESMTTIQLDFLAKERFGLSYTDESGKENSDVFVIHRAPLSTHERFLAFLIEHYAGKFPLWLSPVQVKVLPVSEKHVQHATAVTAALQKAGIRAIIDQSNETLGKKIRTAKLERVYYRLVIGDREQASETYALEDREDVQHASQPIEALCAALRETIEART